MMLYPPIDKLVEKTGNIYVLCNVIAKRAREIETVRRAELGDSDKKAISIACEEVYQGKIVPSDF